MLKSTHEGSKRVGAKCTEKKIQKTDDGVGSGKCIIDGQETPGGEKTQRGEGKKRGKSSPKPDPLVNTRADPPQIWGRDRRSSGLKTNPRNDPFLFCGEGGGAPERGLKTRNEGCPFKSIAH